MVSELPDKICKLFIRFRLAMALSFLQERFLSHKTEPNVWFMLYGQLLNVEIGVECQIFIIVNFFNCSRVLQFGAHSRYYKDALT